MPKGAVIEQLPAGAERVLSFYGLEGAILAMHATSFTQQEEIERLVAMCRSLNPKVALPALVQFRRVLNEVAKAQGLFTQHEQTTVQQNPDGSYTRTIDSSTKLLDFMREIDGEAEARQPHIHYTPLLPPGERQALEGSASAGTSEGDTDDTEGDGQSGVGPASGPGAPGTGA